METENQLKPQTPVENSTEQEVIDSPKSKLRLKNKKLLSVVTALIVIVLLSGSLIFASMSNKKVKEEAVLTPTPSVTMAPSATPSAISPISSPVSKKVLLPSSSPTPSTAKGAYITIQVLDQKTRKPITDVDTKVHLNGPSGAGTFNGPDYTSVLLTPGEYTIDMDTPGGYRQVESNCVGKGEMCYATGNTTCSMKTVVKDGDHQIAYCTYTKD